MTLRGPRWKPHPVFLLYSSCIPILSLLYSSCIPLEFLLYSSCIPSCIPLVFLLYSSCSPLVFLRSPSLDHKSELKNTVFFFKSARLGRIIQQVHSRNGPARPGARPPPKQALQAGQTVRICQVGPHRVSPKRRKGILPPTREREV